MKYERKEKVRSNIWVAVITTLGIVAAYRGDVLFAGIYAVLLVLEITL